MVEELEEKDGLVSCVQLKKNTVISYLLLLNSFMFLSRQVASLTNQKKTEIPELILLNSSG